MCTAPEANCAIGAQSHSSHSKLSYRIRCTFQMTPGLITLTRPIPVTESRVGNGSCTLSPTVSIHVNQLWITLLQTHLRIESLMCLNTVYEYVYCT
jgi:hypothetical protein